MEQEPSKIDEILRLLKAFDHHHEDMWKLAFSLSPDELNALEEQNLICKRIVTYVRSGGKTW